MVSTAAKRSSAQAKHVVESWPPENRTSPFSAKVSVGSQASQVTRHEIERHAVYINKMRRRVPPSQRRVSVAQRKPTAKATARLGSGLCPTCCETVPTARSPRLRNSFAMSKARSCSPCAQCSPTCVKSRMAREAWSIPERNLSIASVASRELSKVPFPPPSDRRDVRSSPSCLCPHIVSSSCIAELPKVNTVEGESLRHQSPGPCYSRD